MTIRAVIFDYGMVLSNPAVPSAHARLVAASGLSAEVLDRHYWAHRHSYDLGMTGRDFWNKVAADAGTTFSAAQIVNLIESDVLMWTSVNEEMLAWVTALQNAGLRTGIISNMVWEILEYMSQRFGWLDRFDHNTWSCALGIAKPDPAIYLQTCEALEVAPAESLFIDDKLENITAAQKAGLQAVQFTTIEQLRRDLESRGFTPAMPVPGAAVATLIPEP
ncbi:MAG: HAD family hydrolase [Acidobacteriaceae bacterium]